MPSSDDLARVIADLERRLRAVERGPQLARASVELEDGATVHVVTGLTAGIQGQILGAQAIIDAEEARQVGATAREIGDAAALIGADAASVGAQAATDAASAFASAVAAQSTADLGVSDALAAQIAAATATGNAATATASAAAALTTANTAQSAAATAASQAATAITAAATAQTQANLGVSNAATAATAAATAQTKANLADSNAAAASGLAATKAVVLYQTAAPGAEYQNINTLWIDTTSGANTPKKWVSGSTWVAVTDKAATDAASAAATAQTAASTAAGAAATAQSQANTATANAATAQSQANTATTNAATAQTQANLGVTNAATAKTQADLGVANAATAQTQANQGVADAATAQTAAATAQTQANLGVSNAATAATAAATAQTKANLADSNAAAASGLAATKAVVLYQTAAPGAGYQNTNTLWIDTTSGANTPKKWVSGSTWVAVTDKAATDAASAAATAQTAASTAAGAAATAQSQANTATANAATAQSQANTATTNAATAQTAANLGVSNAATAQTQANLGVSNAATAQTQANLGVSNAATAQAAAVAAQYAATHITHTSITDGEIWTPALAANAVVADKIAANAVIAGKIAALAVTAGTVAAGAVTAGTLAADSVIAGNVAADAITAREIKANSITAGEIAAGAIDAAAISADALDGRIITGSIIQTAETGARVFQDISGFKLYDAANRIVVDFPTVLDANHKVHIEGDIDAYGLTVADNLRINGLNNEFSQGSVTHLATSVGPPTLGPSITVDWPNAFGPGMGSAAGLPSNFGIRYAGTYANSKYHVPYENVSNGMPTVAIWNADGSPATPSSIQLDVPSPLVGDIMGGITVVGAYYYLLLKTSLNKWFFIKYNTSNGVQVGAAVEITTLAGAVYDPVIGNDGTNIIVAVCNTDTALQIKVYNPTSFALIATHSTTDGIGLSGSDLGAVLGGNFDYGSFRYVVYPKGAPNAGYVFTLSGSTITRQTNEIFTLPFGLPLTSLMWDGSSFVCLTEPPGQWYRFTSIKWTTESGKWWASYAWNNQTLGVQTVQSPRTSFYMTRRARVNMASALIQSGMTPAIESARPFLGRGATDPGYLAMWNSKGTPLAGVTSWAWISDPFSGTTPVSVGNFGSGYPARLESAALKPNGEPKWRLTGDGYLSHGRHGAKVAFTHSGLVSGTQAAMVAAASLERGSAGYLRTATGIVVPADGLYQITGQLAMSGATGTWRSLFDFTFSITPLVGVSNNAFRISGYGEVWISGTAQVVLAQGTVVGLAAYQVSGTTKTATGQLVVIGENTPDGWF